MTNRYQTDPEYRERIKALSRARYSKKKQQTNEPSVESIEESSSDTSESSIDTVSSTVQVDNDRRIAELEAQVRSLKESNYHFVKMMHEFLGKMLIEQNQTRDLTSEVIEEVLKSSINLSSASQHKYKKNLNLLRRYIEYNKPDYNFIRDASSVIEMIQKSGYANTTKSNRLGVLLHISKALSLSNSNLYEDAYNKMNELRDKKRNKNKATEKDFDWILLQEKYNANKAELKGDLRLIGALYIERPPLRTEYCRNLMITDDETKYKNTIIDSGTELKMRLTDFKNAKKFRNREYRYVFPEGNLKTLMLERMREIGKDKPIFTIQSKTFRVKIKEILKIVLGINAGVYQLRHSYETYIQSRPEYFTMDMDEREKLHYDVLHSFGAAMQYRRI